MSKQIQSILIFFILNPATLPNWNNLTSKQALYFRIFRLITDFLEIEKLKIIFIREIKEGFYSFGLIKIVEKVINSSSFYYY